MTHVEKYGEWVGDYLLTNLRALIADVGDRADEFFNTPEECEIIAKHFKVFKSKIDLSTRSQYIRHRASWQELSRRYVSGKKSAFEFYISPKMKQLEEVNGFSSTKLLVDHSLAVYDQAISAGVKPEEARRCLCQAMYTTVWSAWQPKQLDVFFKLRLDKHAQVEIRHLAEAKQQLLKGN
jgi:thymidylate synthase (FAD)